jgi:hypothetical protein
LFFLALLFFFIYLNFYFSFKQWVFQGGGGGIGSAGGGAASVSVLTEVVMDFRCRRVVPVPFWCWIWCVGASVWSRRSCRGGDGGVRIWHRRGLISVMIVCALVRWWWWLLVMEVAVDVA